MRNWAGSRFDFNLLLHIWAETVINHINLAFFTALYRDLKNSFITAMVVLKKRNILMLHMIDNVGIDLPQIR